jgi:ElaB/YqjD/DUF883 family membrane-anchored ribosome-binding protein
MAVAAAARKRKSGTAPMDRRVETLRDDIVALQENMRTLVTDAGDAANGGIHDAVRATENAAQQVLDDVEDWAAGNVDSVRERIQEQPLKACLISLGVGMLLGAWLLRR